MIALFVIQIHSCTTMTPEKILEQQFNITLKGFDYKIETFEEQWCPNGDGHVLIVFKFNKLTDENVNYFQSLGLKKLPFSENKQIPDRFLSEKGFYLMKNEDINDERDFKLFIVDIDRNQAFLYYQCM